MAEQKNPYRLADRAIKILNNRTIRRFEQAKRKSSVKGFDELNVISNVKELYKNLAKDNEEVLLELAKEKYKEENPDGKYVPNMKWLLAIFAANNPVTRYIYENEVIRKRERLSEAVNSTSAKATEYKKALRFWAQMTAQYADIVSDAATIKAFEDAGVKKVRWNTQGDDRVCSVCKERNGKVYPISSIPPKPHWGDRCYFTPVK